MGRSVPPWRTRVEDELGRLAPYRRALATTDQHALDRLVNDVRQRRAAGGMLPAANAREVMLLNMLVGMMARLERLEHHLSSLREGHDDD
jgi:hypothetical protein